MERIETQRLVLRHFEPKDGDDIYRSVYSDDEVCRFYCGRTKARSEISEWIIYRSHQSRGNDFGLLAVELKAETRVIGLCGLQAYVADWLRFDGEADRFDHPLEVELTYALERRSWGLGYARGVPGAHRLRIQRIEVTATGHGMRSEERAGDAAPSAAGDAYGRERSANVLQRRGRAG